MGKVKYEQFNPITGKFEGGEVNEEEVEEVMKIFADDFATYEAERKITEKIIRQHISKKPLEEELD